MERFAKLEDAISILGVPVPVVEIQVSLKKKIAWIVFLNRERKSASKDFHLDERLNLEESARTVENLATRTHRGGACRVSPSCATPGSA